MSDTVTFNLEMRTGRLVYEAWRALTDPLYDMVVPGGAAQFSASFLLNPFSDMALIESRISAAVFRRDPSHLGRSENLIWVTQYLQGEEQVSVGNAVYALRPGAIYIRDMRSPSISRSTDIRQRNVCLSMDTLTDAGVDTSGSLHRCFEIDSRAGRILHDAFIRMFERRGLGVDNDIDTALNNFVGVLSTLLSRSPDASRSAELRQARYRAMCRYLMERLDDSDIGVENLCREFGCSRATVYRLFEIDGGLHRFLREKRLLRLFDELTRTPDKPAIGDMAACWGFNDAAYFSRIFKKTFGVAPVEARRVCNLKPVSDPVSSLLSDTIQRLHGSFRCR